jgi:hypothetical protein
MPDGHVTPKEPPAARSALLPLRGGAFVGIPDPRLRRIRVLPAALTPTHVQLEQCCRPGRGIWVSALTDSLPVPPNAALRLED